MCQLIETNFVADVPKILIILSKLIFQDIKRESQKTLQCYFIFCMLLNIWKWKMS